MLGWGLTGLRPALEGHVLVPLCAVGTVAGGAWMSLPQRHMCHVCYGRCGNAKENPPCEVSSGTRTLFSCR